MTRLAVTTVLLVVGMSTAFAGERLDARLGEPLKINPSKPPDGIQMFQILLEHGALKLKDTPCARQGDRP